MKKRIETLTRISELQNRMHALSRWRLFSLEGQQARLNDDLREIFEMLDSAGLVYGTQAKLGARHIRALQLKLDSVAHEQEAARHAALVQRTRVKLAEKAIETAELCYRRLNERKELTEIIERAIARRRASST